MMPSGLRLAGFALLVIAFFFGVGAVIALGNGDVWIGVLMFLLALTSAFGGWMLWDRQAAR